MNKSIDKVTTSPSRPAVPMAGFQDGVHHINIWIKGSTELGRMLAPQYTTMFTHPYFGPFNSMEGFWYYIRSVDKPEELRHLSGKDAKIFGKKLQLMPVDNFFQIVQVANYHKIAQTPELKEAMEQSTLPFEHYYFEGAARTLARPQGYQFVIRDFTELRQMIQKGIEPPTLDYSSFAKS